jgi:hypothetical protein
MALSRSGKLASWLRILYCIMMILFASQSAYRAKGITVLHKRLADWDQGTETTNASDVSISIMCNWIVIFYSSSYAPV